MKFRCLLTAVTAFALICLPACKSHKATVVRAGEPAVTASKSSDKKKTAKTEPKAPSLDKKESDVDTKIAGELVKEARRWIGTPYRYGQKDRKGTDCSGFTMTLFKDVAGVALPRSSAEQCSYCYPINQKKLQPGDLVFFTSSTRGGKVSHVGLYVGNGKMIHASTSRGVIESGLDEKYYASHYHSSGRVQPITVAATGGKNKKKGDSQELRLASEGVQASAPAPQQKQSKQPAKKSKSKTKSSSESKPAAKPGAESVTLDQFVAMSSNKNAADSVKTAAPADSVKTNEPPKVMVNGKAVSAQPAEKPAAKSEKADSVSQSDAIRNEVTKAMKFGK